MNAVLALLLLLVSGGIVFLAPSKAPVALVIASASASIAIICINRIDVDRKFLLQVFMGGVLIRLIVGTIIFVFEFQNFFGGDADTYDQNGFFMQQGWHGNKYYAALPERYIQSGACACGARNGKIFSRLNGLVNNPSEFSVLYFLHDGCCGRRSLCDRDAQSDRAKFRAPVFDHSRNWPRHDLDRRHSFCQCSVCAIWK